MIVLLYFYVGAIWWVLFVVGQVILLACSAEARRLRNSTLYWIGIAGAVGASFANPWTAVWFGMPVCFMVVLLAMLIGMPPAPLPLL